MKKAQFIEWGIIAIALIFGYKFLENLVSLVFQFFSYGLDGNLLPSQLLPLLLFIVLYAVLFILLIKNSHKIAEYFTKSDAASEPLTVKIGKRPMLQVILIALCLFTILSNIAGIIYYIADLFKNEVQREGFFDPDDRFMPAKQVLIVKVIQVVVAAILIATSKKISDALIAKNEADELVFDSKTGD